ncbi:MAG TPA: hypothetical protein VGM56_27950 [Byssovorax sp.]
MSVLRRALQAVAIVAIGVAAVTARVAVAGEEEIARSTDELRSGHAMEAAQHAGRAAAWYAPGAPHVRVAYARLIALATAAEGVGDRDTALFAWRAVRGAAIETRWIVTPHERDLARADEAIARLAAAAPRPVGTRVDPSSEVQREQLAALARDESPDVAWVIALVAGAFALGLGVLITVRRGLTETGQLLWLRARPGLALAALGFVLYAIALWRA